MRLVVPLDARRDLPKVRASLDTLLVTIREQACRFSSPCAIGAMIDDRDMLARLDQYTDEAGRTGAKTCFLRFNTVEEMDDLLCLQHDFDSGQVDMFLSTLNELEVKYLSTPPAKSADGSSVER
jgi:hypothetical protein